MHNKRRALLAAVLVAIPSPFLLAFLLYIFSPELFNFRTAGGVDTITSDVLTLLGSASGLVAYISSFVLFAIAGYIVALIASAGGSTRVSRPRQRGAMTAQPTTPVSAPERHAEPAGDAEEGLVKWFNVKKGFGFITRDNGDDIFVHFRAIEGQGRRVLRQGQRVSYIVVKADKGLQADQVEVVGEE